MAEEAMMHRRIFVMIINGMGAVFVFIALTLKQLFQILFQILFMENLSWSESRQVCTETSGSAPLPEENIWAAFRVFKLSTTTWVT